MVFKFNRGEFYTATPELKNIKDQQILDHGFEYDKQSNTMILVPKELKDKHAYLLKKYLLERRKNIRLNLGEIVTLLPSNIERCKIEGVIRRTPTYWYAVSHTKLQKLTRNYFDLDSFIYASPKELVTVSQYEVCTRHIKYSVENSIFRIPFESQKQHVHILDQRRKEEPIVITPKTRVIEQSGPGSKRQKIAGPCNNEQTPAPIDQKSVIGNVIAVERTLKNIQEKQAESVSETSAEQKNDVGNVIAVYEDIDRKAVVRYYILEKDSHGILLANTTETAFNRTSTIDSIYESRVLSWKVKHKTESDGTILIDAKEQQLYRNLVKPGMKWTDPRNVNLGSADSLSVDREEPDPVQPLAPETTVQ